MSLKLSGLKMCGLYSQALSEGFSEVIQTYKKTLMEVEALVIGNHNYTLSFVYSYVEKYRGLFNMLNKIIAAIEQRRLTGCQILSLLHQYILNANERVHEAVIRFVCTVTRLVILYSYVFISVALFCQLILQLKHHCYRKNSTSSSTLSVIHVCKV